MHQGEPITIVNILGDDLPHRRLLELRDRYRRAIDDPSPASPPRWYAEQVLAQAEALLRRREGRVAA